jgi:hypothetical protein
MIYDNNTTTGNDTLQIYTTTTPNNTIGNNLNGTLNDDRDNGAIWSIIGIILLIAIIIAIVIGATKDKDDDQNKNRK